MKPIATATLLALLSASAVAPALAAQLRPAPGGGVEQVGRPQPVGMDQVARPAGATPARASKLVAPQVSEKRDRDPPARQLTSERGAGAARQLSDGRRSAQPSQALSLPSDGRTAAVDRIAGSDRCDPASRDRARPRCANVIETRAAEFARPDPTPLSPEQRIIMEQQQRERSATIGGAARRLANNGEDSRSIEAQGVASVVLAAPPTQPGPVKPGADPAASEQLNALVNAIINRPQP